ncbi:hypothetical protein EDC48_11198 [Gibbsiella quercinecans]|nr:hypothetical protein EDC48_11198 [Gibbsiella quercinecans]
MPVNFLAVLYVPASPQWLNVLKKNSPVYAYTPLNVQPLSHDIQSRLAPRDKQRSSKLFFIVPINTLYFESADSLRSTEKKWLLNISLYWP